MTSANQVSIKYYEALGFKKNPFETNNAEKESEIEKYAVRPPYLEPVELASKETGSFTLVGSRGSGKSATRITIQRNLLISNKPYFLPIALTNFSMFRTPKSIAESLNLYANQIFFLTIEAVLIHLSSLDDSDSQPLIESLNKTNKKFIGWALQNFYLNRPLEQRISSAHECFDLFAVSYAKRSQIWAERRWDSLATILTSFTSAVAKYFGADVGDASNLSEAISGIANQSGGEKEPTYILAKAVEFSRCFGFAGVLVQVDKVDETDWTNNDPKAAADLVWPLYSNILFHEINGLSWSFFIWDRVRDLLNEENDYPVRWDKLTNRRIKWDERYLRDLVEKRIEFYSDGKLKKIIDIFDDSLDEDLVYQELITMSGYSPRHLINILNAILMDHIQTNEEKVCLIGKEALDKGLDSYAQVTLLDQYSSDTLSQIKKMGKTEFINKDVAKVFSISGPGAKQKIEKWIKIGIANRDGQIFAGERVKPVDKFVISDQRIKRLIERNLDVML